MFSESISDVAFLCDWIVVYDVGWVRRTITWTKNGIPLADAGVALSWRRLDLQPVNCWPAMSLETERKWRAMDQR
jgi:hypothetical protein